MSTKKDPKKSAIEFQHFEDGTKFRGLEIERVEYDEYVESDATPGRELLGTFQGAPVYADESEVPYLDPRVAPEVQALVQAEFEEKREMLRKGTHEDPTVRMLMPERLVDFVNQTRRLGLDEIEGNLVEETVPVMVWKLREFALKGLYTQARAVEIWLNWAEKIRSRPPKESRTPSAASAAFLPRGITVEADAKSIDSKPRPHLKSAGKYIGKAKRLRAPKKYKPKPDTNQGG